MNSPAANIETHDWPHYNTIYAMLKRDGGPRFLRRLLGAPNEMHSVCVCAKTVAVVAEGWAGEVAAAAAQEEGVVL